MIWAIESITRCIAKDKATETANRVEQTIRQNSLYAVAVDLRFLFGVFTSAWASVPLPKAKQDRNEVSMRSASQRSNFRQ
jgi:hypothetical protein